MHGYLIENIPAEQNIYYSFESKYKSKSDNMKKAEKQNNLNR